MGIESFNAMPVLEEEPKKEESALEKMEGRENMDLVAKSAAKFHDYLEQLNSVADAQKALREAESKGFSIDLFTKKLEDQQIKAHAILDEALSSPVAAEAIAKLKDELSEQHAKNVNQGLGGDEIFDTYFKNLAQVEDKLKG